MNNAGHAVAGWVVAAGVSVAALWFPVFVLRAPVVSSLSPDQVATYVVTTFDVWGGSTTTTTGVGLSVEVPGGPNYAVAIVPCVVLLLAAAGTGLRRGRPRSRVASMTSVAAPIAAGALAAVAGCQLLAYRAAMRPSPPGGLYGGGEQRPDGELGWSCWLLTVAAVLAVSACVPARAPAPSTPTPTPAPVPTAATPPMAPAPPTPATAPTPPLETTPTTDLDPAVFRRPVTDRKPTETPRD